MQQQILKEANELMKQKSLRESLDKYLEYIKLDPLNSYVHLQIGRIYTLLHRQNENS